ncbi:hypothetical protein BDV93DRAFT_516654 [Ceratobasidium sp. AG-I]|nr:hypothetical protein BDV93DRAFT_516654 [Ceratobasidium sp. AG-I]
MSMRPPAYRVFEVPELVGMICGFMEKRNLVKLLTVSQPFFHCIVSHVWKEVIGISKLLVLLPSSGPDELSATSFDDVRPCNQLRLARFNIYAPYVQRLESNTKNDLGSLGWDLLLSRVPTRPVLPNLRALTINPCFAQNSARFIDYIHSFLCPTLSDVRTSLHWNPWMNPLGARDLLVRMAAICPGLTKLNIIPKISHHPDSLLKLGLYSPASLFAPISQFQDLCVLYSSSAMLNPDTLRLLGDLPHLESLGAYSVSIDEEGDEDADEVESPIASLTLPEHSFPALRHLEIDHVPATVVSKIWQTPPLVRNLVSVKVQFTPSDTALLDNLICVICRGSPQTTNLELDLSQIQDVELSSTVMEHFQRLPLRRVRIRDAYASCEPLALALPNVEYLDINGMRLSFDELTVIAKHMSELQYLSVGLYLWAMSGNPTFLHESSSPSSCQVDSWFAFESLLHVTDPDFDEHIENIARGLQSLWPRGVRCAFWSLGKDLRRKRDIEILERVNDRIRTLSGASVLDIPTAEESASHWLYDSW